MVEYQSSLLNSLKRPKKKKKPLATKFAFVWILFLTGHFKFIICKIIMNYFRFIIKVRLNRENSVYVLIPRAETDFT